MADDLTGIVESSEAERLATEPTFALLCGHYGGVDERV